MDRNSITGFVLIGLIIFGFMFYQSDQLSKKAAYDKKIKDSLALIQPDTSVFKNATFAANTGNATDTALATINTAQADSIADKKLQDAFGVFAPATKGTEQFVTLENEKVKITISNKGGRVCSVELKDYKTYDSLPLVLFHGDSSTFRLNFFAQNRNINTDQLYFQPTSNSIVVSGSDSASISMRLYAGDNKYLEYQYILSGNSYILNSSINTVNMQDVINANTNYFLLDWGINVPRSEKNLKTERASSTIYYQYANEEIDYLTKTSDKEEDLKTPLKWISFNEQFFSTTLIAGNKDFDAANINTQTNEQSDKYVKQMTACITIPFDARQPQGSFPMKFYFGPNHYQTLKAQGIGLEDQISLGWSFLSYINKFLVIPLFNFLGNYIANYGIIILILTLVLKTLLFPLTYKAYLSTARMRVIKPELDAIDKKYQNKQEDMLKSYQEKQQVMSQAGVNALGGCLPMLLQLPILIALFNFFPSSIELRQQGFLWANDLSTYDSILDFGVLPIINTIYGDHISLFALLMTASTFASMLMNNQQMATGPQAQQMKWMMYLMPVIFLGVLNSSSAALSYYYFLANMITIAQTLIMQKFVDEKALHAKIEAYRKKPASQKKSSFQKRLEEMAKQRGVKMPK